VTETAAPEAPVAVSSTATAETITTGEESEGIEVLETEAFAFTAPPVEPVAQQEMRADVETGTVEAAVAPVETDLAATLAAKEASLIEARRRDGESAESAEASKAIEPLAASPHLESPAASFDLTTESTPATFDGDDEPQPVYRSDFAAGSGHPAVGDEDWIDLDADEREVSIQAIEPAAPPPAELPGPFYAEDAGGWPATTDAHAGEARRDGTDSLFDSLEVETFETNAAEPAPIVSTPFSASASVEDAQTQTLDYDDSPAATRGGDSRRGAEIVKAEKGLSIADGSDEDTYSIIPKGIQLRLTSDDASERAASVLALSRLNTDEAFNQICAAFDDPMEEVRNAAARAIYDLNEDRADSFTRALRESPVERRRQIGSALAGSGLAEEAIGNLTGESRDKTYDAFSLLFLMAKAGEVAPLIRAIESHHDNEVRLAVVKLLALSGQHEILPSFRRLAVRGSLPTEVRSAVMEAIYQISSQPNAPTPAA